MGRRVIIYIDDIMVETESDAREHTAGLIFLLENLGLILNYPKSWLEPTKEIDFLGSTVNSNNSMEIKPGKKIWSETKKLIDATAPEALTLSRLLGKLYHATQQSTLCTKGP